MSYEKLASELSKLGKKVADNHQKLEGIALAKAAESLERAKNRVRIFRYLG